MRTVRKYVSFFILKVMVIASIVGLFKFKIGHFRIPMSIQYGRRATDEECRAMHTLLLGMARNAANHRKRV